MCERIAPLHFHIAEADIMVREFGKAVYVGAVEGELETDIAEIGVRESKGAGIGNEVDAMYFDDDFRHNHQEAL